MIQFSLPIFIIIKDERDSHDKIQTNPRPGRNRTGL
jgi:hypothetical protein